MLPAVHSNPSGRGRWATEITFRNEAEVTITVHPITTAGRRARGRKIEPGKSTSINARLGGAYVVESIDGTIHEIHSPNWPTKPIVIK